MEFSKEQKPSVVLLLKQYRGKTLSLVVITMLANIAGMSVPLIVSHGIDQFVAGETIRGVVLLFILAMIVAFAIAIWQNIAQVRLSELVARDLRRSLSSSIAGHSYAFVQKMTAGRLLTNITTDIDSVKNFVSQAVVNVISSIVMFLGSAILLLTLQWKLALVVLAVVPIIGGAFAILFGRVGKLFLRAREVVDRLNKIINESVVGAALIRVVNGEKIELRKFETANEEARVIGTGILGVFSALIPIVTFVSNGAVLAILLIGGRLVILDHMSIGDFTAFNSYLMLLIYPIFMIGFMSSIIAQANVGYARIMEVLQAPETFVDGTETPEVNGDISVANVSVAYGDKQVLRDVSFDVGAGKRVAIIGPTAAGKSQLLHALVGLVTPDSGTVSYSGTPIHAFVQSHLYKYISFVFQDSVLFNTSIRENIAFNTAVSDAAMQKAIETAELADFIGTLSDGIETIVSERGTTLSGGQKQRIMLARALALEPRVLLLDDFTARVDVETEGRVMRNIAERYPNITIVSVAQKIASIVDYDKIIVLLEGEVVATGTHAELMNESPEYVQIYNSQQSLNEYEV